ncbi:MAG: aminotransferase class III-fold pyridoxal phosphate-dependent enzyme [Pseudomonadota bacterium]
MDDHDLSGLTDGVEAIQDAHVDHYIQSWSVQGARPKVIAGGEGSCFWDSDGKRYLDFQSQLVNLNLGHQHPKLVQAIKDQADTLCYIGPGMGNAARSTLARKIAEVMPGDLTSTFFTTGGAVANEHAIRLARHITGREKVVARFRSYHGATATTLALTGDPRHHLISGHANAGIVRILDPYCYRCPMGRDVPGSCGACTGAHLEEVLMYERPETVAAVILETVVGTNGIIVPPDGYLPAIREICDRHGILLILDEVMAGWGRTGRMFACEHWDVVPDIITTAKGINSGYVPLGAMTVRKGIADWLRSNMFPGGLTYAGHPLACAVASASIDVYREENIVETAAARGDTFRAMLDALAERHPSIGDVRGRGLFLAIELVSNRETRAPLVPYAAKGDAAAPMQRIMKDAMARGLYLSFFSNVIRLTPPLNISEEDLGFARDVLDEVLASADALVTG